MFDELHPSKFITGAGGITEGKGITMYDYIGAYYFGKITDMIERLILVADHSKFGRNVLVQAFPFNSIRKVVTVKTEGTLIIMIKHVRHLDAGYPVPSAGIFHNLSIRIHQQCIDSI